MPEPGALERLIEAGLIERDDGALKTTRRWQSAMVRAAGRLYGDDAPFDLRKPIAFALLEVFGAETDSSELVPLVQVMLALEARELDRLMRPGVRAT